MHVVQHAPAGTEQLQLSGDAPLTLGACGPRLLLRASGGDPRVDRGTLRLELREALLVSSRLVVRPCPRVHASPSCTVIVG